jgi:hypothetical protein
MSTPEKECLVCGAVLYGRADKSYCSVKCRVKAHRQEQAELVEQEDESEQELSDLPWLSEAEEPTPSETDEDEDVDMQEVVEKHFSKFKAKEEKQRLAQQEQDQIAQASEVHQVYVEAIESFLYWEGQEIGKAVLRELLALVIDSREGYKNHPHLSKPGSTARQRLDDLRDATEVLQEVYKEAQRNWLFGSTSSYELKNKWKKQLRGRLFQ